MPAQLILVTLAFTLSLVLTPAAIALAKRLQLMDVPSELSIHLAPIPRSGGLAIGFAFAGTLAVAGLANWLESDDTLPLIGILCGNAVIMGAGLLDDTHRITPLQKFLAEFLAAAIAVGLGIQVGILPALGISLGVALFYLVSSANAMNLLDGMNGLATGVAAIAAFFLAGLALVENSYLAFIVSIAVLGSTLGFLPYNFPRARIFMGDTGSLFLGFTLASVAIWLSTPPYEIVGFFAGLLIIGLPVLDTSAAMVRRFSRLADLFTGDRDHLYDLLGRRLGTNTAAVIATWCWGFIFGLSGLAVAVLPPALGVSAAALVVLASLVMAARLGAFGPELAGKMNLRAAAIRVFDRYGHPILADVVLIVVSFYVALLIRFSEAIPHAPDEAIQYAQVLTSQIVFIIIVYTLTNSIFGLYNRIWRYASSQEVTSIIGSVALGSAVLLVANGLIGQAHPLPISILLLGAVLLIGLSSAYRYRWRLITGPLFRLRVIDDGTRQQVLIVGAGETGQLLAWRMIHQSNRYQVVGFVDDDPQKIGLRAHGVKVLGDCHDIPGLTLSKGVALLVIAMPQLSKQRQHEILAHCLETQARVKILPDVLNLLGGANGLPALKDVAIADLVGLPEVRTDEETCRKLIRGKRLLVTGAAGSIGSELCRQLIRLEPSCLIALDNNESGLFDLIQEVNGSQSPCGLEPVVGDVTHAEQMAWVFEKYAPQIVFHCADYKHVPLMESFPCEAVQVNIGGTLALIRLAESKRIERFVYISSDKAVHPTGTMGVTKAIGEWLIRTRPKDGTLFTAVRFGNILGSRGNVVSIFGRQIDQGGPVTVTDPEMTRSFMSAQIAISLIIEVAALTDGSDLFVLDAGHELRIDDLARRMIRLRGLRPDKDIRIVYTGVRPGEKIHETPTCSRCERREPTGQAGVFRVEACRVEPAGDLVPEIENVVALSRVQDANEVLATLALLVATIQSCDSVSDRDTTGEIGAQRDALPLKRPAARAWRSFLATQGGLGS